MFRVADVFMFESFNVACDFRHGLHPYFWDKDFKDSKPSFLERIAGIAIFILSIPLTLGIGTAFLLYTAHRKVVQINHSSLNLSSALPSSAKKTEKQKNESGSGLKETELFQRDISSDQSVNDMEGVSDIEEVSELSEKSQVTNYSAKEFKNLILKGYQFSGKIKVKGDLDFSDSASLTSLPEGLVVEGNFYLYSCTSLSSLPMGLVVEGSLYLSGCTSLISLPEGLFLGGNLALRDCTSLISLPKGLEVRGYLDLNGCTSLSSLPKGLKIRGDLDFRDSPSLTFFREGLVVEGNLYLFGCTSLTSLPEGLEVGGHLHLRGCTSLTSLPKSLKVQGDLDLYGCTSLTSLSECFYVEGNLYLFGCTSLITLPDNFVVKGNLDLSYCTSLISLPQGFKTQGDLNLSYCTSLISLPQGFKTQGDLNLSYCTRLTSLPEDLDLGGELYLSNCTSLTTLPDSFVVKGDLFLGSCTRLTSLPEGLVVEGDLFLGSCTNLISLPEGLEMGGNLDLSRCTSLTSLPNSITELGYRSDGELRVIDLTGTGLSETVIQNLQQSNHSGIQFYYSQAGQQPSLEFTTLDQGLEFWTKLAEKQAPHVEINGLSVGNVMDYLSRLTTTQEYKNLQTRKYLAERLIDVFKLMGEDNGIKEHAVNLIEEGLSSCDDRIISALNEIELMVQVNEIEKGDHNEKDLKTLGKRFLLLEMVNKKAAEHIDTLSFVDEIEVYLAFQICLADRFKLPIKTRNMIFRNCANVTDQKIKEYGDEIEEECTEEKLNTFLQAWSPWVELQKNNAVVPLYDELPLDEKTYKEKDLVCAIFKDEPERPVSYKETIYGYDAFVQQYKTNGTNPMNTREKLDLQLLKRVKVSGK